MTFRARFTVPYLDATVVEYLDTGGGFESQGELVRAVAAKENTYTVPSDASITYPNAHTLRLRFTFPEARNVDRIVLEGIQQTSGLSYRVASGAGTELVPSTPVPTTGDYDTTNLIVRLASSFGGNTIDLELTGLTQPLQLEGIFIGYTSFVPGFNFDWGGRYREVPSAQIVQVAKGNSLRFTDRSRSHGLVFSDVTEVEYKELRNFYRNKLVRGYCLFERDQETTDDWYLAVVQMSEFTHPNYDGYTVNVTALEVNEWL